MSFSKKYQDLESYSFINGASPECLEEILQNLDKNTNTANGIKQPLNTELQQELKSLVAEDSEANDHQQIQQLFIKLARAKPVLQTSKHASSQINVNAEYVYKLHKVLKLIEGYRNRGHQQANIDPLGRNTTNRRVKEIELDALGLTDKDLEIEFAAPDFNNNQPIKLKDLIASLQEIYCSTIGYEYNYISHTSKKEWLKTQIESSENALNQQTKTNILNRLIASEGLEKHLHNKYLGQKRFSLEGGDSLIVALDAIIKESSSNNVEEILIGMAHRGRLNILINTFGKNPADLFKEFEGNSNSKVYEGFSGDVKYHMGFSSDLIIDDKEMHLVLAFNPSHLEIVSPVVEGSVRARQDELNDSYGTKILPLIIHGDSAFAGQGVVMESFSMGETRGYSTKGTVHLVINNQIGFTTSAVKDVRSTNYCTDVAKMINAPIIHVNGDDPEAVYKIAKLALQYRQRFNSDIIIDLVCYRRHGHNESDEPSVTQPEMYQLIKQKPTIGKLYAQQLAKEGFLSSDISDELLQDFRDKLERGETVAPYINEGKTSSPRASLWGKFTKQNSDDQVDTSMRLDALKQLATEINTIPSKIKLHSRVSKIIKDRLAMSVGDKACDWGFAENLSYATLLSEGKNVRLSGQDCGRGTFFHRHSVIHNQENGETYIPLRNIKDSKAKFLVIDSLLSEEAVLAFEYGYATTNPENLVVWEAQFGDFANGAQVVIDQFISSGEVKWQRLCGLVMLLPHGYEGQGPEHSSARLERYMQLCAEKNMTVTVPTTPAQIYHLLRAQMISDARKPLIVMSPKSLLRNPKAVSSLDELAKGKFEKIIDDKNFDKKSAKQVTRIIFTYGKIYYDLDVTRTEQKHENTAIIRVEQLYPFASEDVIKILKKYSNLENIVWAQEEPKNQGAWRSIRHRLEDSLLQINLPDLPIKCAARPSSASPAVGYPKVSAMQQQEIIDTAFSLLV